MADEMQRRLEEMQLRLEAAEAEIRRLTGGAGAGAGGGGAGGGGGGAGAGAAGGGRRILTEFEARQIAWNLENQKQIRKMISEVQNGKLDSLSLDDWNLLPENLQELFYPVVWEEGDQWMRTTRIMYRRKPVNAEVNGGGGGGGGGAGGGGGGGDNNCNNAHHGGGCPISRSSRRQRKSRKMRKTRKNQRV